MTSQGSTSESDKSATALFLLALTAVVFFASQIAMAVRNGETMRWQLENLEKQIKSLQEAKSQFAELISKREEQVKQSSQIQLQYTNLLNEILDLSQTDGDAKKIVEKFGIQRQTPAAGNSEDKASKSPEKEPAKPADKK
ncbi:MAG: hypothetical protein RLZZ253_30 [Verrucomicrobiota bacterium]